MKREIFLVAILVIVTGLIGACGGGGSNNTPATTYTMVGTTCYNSANQPVANTYCPNASGYYNQNGACYNSAQQQVPLSYCPVVGNTPGGGFPVNGSPAYGYGYGYGYGPGYYPPPYYPYPPYQNGGYFYYNGH